MNRIGKIESLWRYPVKSMAGERLPQVFAGFSGIYGDRIFAFKSAAGDPGFPYLTGREQARMLLYRPRFRDPEGATQPPNLSAAQSIAPGINPLYADAGNMALDVITPGGENLSIEDPALLSALSAGIRGEQGISLLRSDRSMTDCRPVSLFSIQTAKQLGSELEIEIDERRFRANVYMDLEDASGFTENSFVGRTLQLGSSVQVSVRERDPRCKMITIDPDTAEANPDILRKVVKSHNGVAGVYAAVMVEGLMRQGDDILLLE